MELTNNLFTHAVGTVFHILLAIVIVARCFPRLAMIIGQYIIHVICLLLLLAYTSIASTSLQLLRPLTFINVDGVYILMVIIWHINIIAILCEVIIVIGLPLLLLLEPLLSRRIRVKPLLDQFQLCYKNKYCWFAIYYLISRQVIILIVYVCWE